MEVRNVQLCACTNSSTVLSQLRGNKYRHAWVCCAVAPVVLRNDEIDWDDLRQRLAAGEFDNVVISPGPGTPSCAADIGEVATLPDVTLQGSAISACGCCARLQTQVCILATCRSVPQGL